MLDSKCLVYKEVQTDKSYMSSFCNLYYVLLHHCMELYGIAIISEINCNIMVIIMMMK